MESYKKHERSHHHHRRKHSHKSHSRHHHRHHSDSPKPARRRSRERSPAKPVPVVPNPQEKSPKIKGRGSDLELGLRSWTETCPQKPVSEVKAEVKLDEEQYRINEKWVNADYKEFESAYSKQVKSAPKWQHDKFEKLLRGYENEQRQKELKMKKSEWKRSKDSPNWQHDKFESVLRNDEPLYQYMVRMSPPVHEEEVN